MSQAASPITPYFSMLPPSALPVRHIRFCFRNRMEVLSYKIAKITKQNLELARQINTLENIIIDLRLSNMLMEKAAMYYCSHGRRRRS